MESKASINATNVNNEDKQKVNLSYYLGSFDNIQDAQTAKFAFDKIAEQLGATISQEACILGENETNISQEEAESVKLKVDGAKPLSEPEPPAPTTAV